METKIIMATFQVRITKDDNHRCLKFKSELPIEAVFGAIKAVVKSTYVVSIKEIEWKVSEDRTLIWAVKEAASIRFYHKVWKETVIEVPLVIKVGSILMPHDTIVQFHTTTNTFFNIYVPHCFMKLDISKINKELGLEINVTSSLATHPFYIPGIYSIEREECDKGVMVTFYKKTIKHVVKNECVTEEL